MIDFDKLKAYHKACKARYKLGAKAPLGTPAKDISLIDCSGYIRCILFDAAGLRLPDGSQNQLRWARTNLRKLAKYEDVRYAKADPGRVFIAFLSPKPGNEWPRHVWLCYMGKTMESASGLGGVGSRWWDAFSPQCKECFEVKVDG